MPNETNKTKIAYLLHCLRGNVAASSSSGIYSNDHTMLELEGKSCSSRMELYPGELRCQLQDSSYLEVKKLLN